jgi:hypothetical protein
MRQLSITPPLTESVGRQTRCGNGRNVTFPARQYPVNGESRSFALLRPIADNGAQDRIRDLVLQAYAKYEQETAAEAAL